MEPNQQLKTNVKDTFNERRLARQKRHRFIFLHSRFVFRSNYSAHYGVQVFKGVSTVWTFITMLTQHWHYLTWLTKWLSIYPVYKWTSTLGMGLYDTVPKYTRYALSEFQWTVRLFFFKLQTDLGAVSILPLAVATEKTTSTNCPVWFTGYSKRHCSFNLSVFISVLEPFTRLIHPPQNADRKSMIKRKSEWICPACIMVMSRRVWVDDVLQRLIRNHVPYNRTPKVMLATVDCGHCGWLITGASAVTVPS